MNGAAWTVPFIKSFKTKEAWIKDRLKSESLWPDKSETTRTGMLSQVWDIANPEPAKKKK